MDAALSDAPMGFSSPASPADPMASLDEERPSKALRKEDHLLEQVRELLHEFGPVQDKLSGFIQRVQAALGGEGAHFYLFDELAGALVLQTSTLFPSYLFGVLRLPADRGTLGKVTSERAIVLMEEVEPWEGSEGFRTVYVPLQVGSRFLGVVVLERIPVREPSKELKSVLSQVDDLISPVLASDLDRAAMEERVRRLSRVQQEGLKLLSVSDEDHLARQAAVSLKELVRAECVVIRFVNRNDEILSVRAIHGVPPGDLEAGLLDLDERVCSRVAQKRQTEVFHDLVRLDPSLPNTFRYINAASSPLLLDGQTLGTLSIYNKTGPNPFIPAAFGRDDVELIESFGGYVARALQHVRKSQTQATLITIDGLTGLGNERYLMHRLPEEIRRAERHQRKLSLLIIEARPIHLDQPLQEDARGREIIRRMAEVLEETFRNVDILVRLQGGRFAVLMPDTGEAIPDIPSRLVRGLSSLPVVVFLGRATSPTYARTGQELMRKASEVS